MKYNQRYLDELCKRLPYLFWTELEKAVNGKKRKNLIPMSTIKDTLRVYRDGTKGIGRKVKVDKQMIIEKAVELLESKGIEAPQITNH